MFKYGIAGGYEWWTDWSVRSLGCGDQDRCHVASDLESRDLAGVERFLVIPLPLRFGCNRKEHRVEGELDGRVKEVIIVENGKNGGSEFADNFFAGHRDSRLTGSNTVKALIQHHETKGDPAVSPLGPAAALNWNTTSRTADNVTVIGKGDTRRWKDWLRCLNWKRWIYRDDRYYVLVTRAFKRGRFFSSFFPDDCPIVTPPRLNQLAKSLVS